MMALSYYRTDSDSGNPFPSLAKIIFEGTKQTNAVKSFIYGTYLIYVYGTLRVRYKCARYW